MFRAAINENKQNATAWIVFLLLLLSLQGVLLWVDHQPMFFFGDSASYIWTAVTGWLPGDRSFVYGYFVRLVAVTTQSLFSLIIVQVFFLMAASVMMAKLLMQFFQVRPWIAFGTALLTTLEPLQLLYTRYVMTETLALLIFSVYLWCVLQYLAVPRIKWLIAIQCVATLMISIRFAFIPMVWIGGFTIPLLAFTTVMSQKPLTDTQNTGRLAAHFILSIFLLFLFTSAYKHLHGYLQHKPPAYSYDSGFFALADVLPIVDPADFCDQRLGEHILSNPDFPAKDRRARSAHRWMDGGAVFRLQNIVPDRIKADEIARKAALHAVIHKPLAFLKLGWQTFTDFFDNAYLQSCIETDLGNFRLKEEFHRLVTIKFHYASDLSSALDLQSPTGRYFLRSAHWFRILLFLPIGWVLLWMLLRDNVQRRMTMMLCLTSLICISVALFLEERPTPRYLHIAAYLFFLAVGIGWNLLLPVKKIENRATEFRCLF